MNYMYPTFLSFFSCPLSLSLSPFLFLVHAHTLKFFTSSSLCSTLQTLMVQVWYPMTVCTNSRAQKEIIAKVSTM